MRRASWRDVAPRDLRLLAAARMRGQSASRLREGLGWTAKTLGQRLSILRRAGAGRTLSLYSPEQSGRTVHSATDVKLRRLERTAQEAFESWCRSEAAITSAAAVAGRWDYTLWTWHVSEQAASTWALALSQRDDVLRVERRALTLCFGHGLAGAPVFHDD